jgi:hypothetical protein
MFRRNEWMKITRNKAVTLVTAILLSLMVSSIFAAAPMASAVTSGAGFQYIYITLAPGTSVGINQTIDVTVYCMRCVGAVGNPASSFFHNFTVFVHRPDNKTDYIFHQPNVDPDWVCWDSTASAYASYQPPYPIFGNYTFEFYFPNQTVGSSNYYNNYNATAWIMVINGSVPAALDSYPLPSEYWYRPVESQNTWWAGYASSPTSNWYNSVRDKNYNGNPNVRYQPDGQAPSTAHIMWASLLYGSGAGNYAPNITSTYTAPLLSTQIAMNGLLYYPTLDGYWRQVDLRTGQLINQTSAASYPNISFGFNYDMESGNTHGVLQPGFLFTDNYSRAISADVLAGGHGWSWTMNAPPSVTGQAVEAIGPKGEHVMFSVANAGTTNSPRWVVRDFNTSKVFSSASTTLSVTSWTTANMSDWQYNVVTRNGSSMDNVLLGTDSIAVGSYTTTDVYNNGFNVAVLLCKNGSLPTPGSTKPVTYFAVALQNETINGAKYLNGQLMWMMNVDPPKDGSSLVQGPTAEGIFTLVSPETGTWSGYDMYSGRLLWTTDPQTNSTSYGYTPQTSITGCTVSIGNHKVNLQTNVPIVHTGQLITAGMGGNVFCYDVGSGALLWHKSYPLAYSAKVTYYPTNIGLLADGKVYLGTYNTGANDPLLPGSMIRCLNATSGDELWALPGFGSAGGYSLSDGYMFFANYYDLKVYCVGKGPSEMNFNPTPNVAKNGAVVNLTGTCLDISPGSPIKGSAAISDESMSGWMAYKFMNQPMPTDVTGVTVYLSTVDPNNNTDFIGTATVQPDGTFNYQWTPPVPGMYQLTAQFLGSNSYYPSFAHSTVFVGDQPATNGPTPTPVQTPANTENLVIYSAAAIMATFIVIALAIFLSIRKRP